MELTPADTTTFDRWDGTGKTTEYRTPAVQGETLAYIDYSEDHSRAAVTVFIPYKGSMRTYVSRPVDNAEAIIDRHLTKLGYTR